MKLSSPAFFHQALMPSVYTCDGQNISPQLEWDGLPKGTQSLALIMDDPDATSGTWVHWVIFNIPSSINSLEENIPREHELPNGGRQGVNSSGKIGYIGPCPPSGKHRYFFKLYALDKHLELEAGGTNDGLLRSMQDHILEEAQLIGLYQRIR